MALGVIFGQGANEVKLKYYSVREKGPTPAENGLTVEADYDAEMSDELLREIANTGERVYATVPVRWVINGETSTEDGSVTLEAYFDHSLGRYVPVATLSTTKFLSPGTYNAKAYIPEEINMTVKFCVYAYSPIEEYYTDLIGCYDTYEEAKREAEGRDAIVSPEAENVTCTGEVEVDLGIVTLGGKKAPGKPPEKEPIWYPGKFLKKIIGK